MLRRFGAVGVRAHVRSGMDLAEHFASRVRRSQVIELAAPVSLSLICFRRRVPSGTTPRDT